MPWITPNRLTATTQAKSSSGQLGDRQATAADTGVVAHQMDVAEVLEGGRRQRRHVGRHADVGGHGEHVGARRRELLAGAVEHRPLHVGDDDAHPLGGEALGHRQADARCPTRDHGDLAGEISHQTRSRYAEWSSSGSSCSARAVPS